VWVSDGDSKPARPKRPLAPRTPRPEVFVPDIISLKVSDRKSLARVRHRWGTLLIFIGVVSAIMVAVVTILLATRRRAAEAAAAAAVDVKIGVYSLLTANMIL
jgi:hypothetical protein